MKYCNTRLDPYSTFKAVVSQGADDCIALVVAPAEHAPGRVVGVAAGFLGVLFQRRNATILVAAYAVFAWARG